jgi:two-component system response regulator FlrC
MLEMVESGKFREDLYFRLNVIPLALPALRERMDDLPILVEHFLDKHARLNKRERPAVSPETMAILKDYRWRGNVRELENVVERALLLCDGKEIKPHNLLMHSQMGKQSINQDLARATSVQPASETEAATPESKESALGIEVGMSMKEAEKKLIFETLRETGGNRTKAAKILGISIRTLRNKLNEYRAEGEDIEVEAEN